MARRGFKKFMDKRSPATFKIQITSMVDMFVILLVFLLKSYSTSPVQLSTGKDMTLPASTSSLDPVDVLKLQVSKNAIYVEDKKVADLKNGQIDVKDMDQNDTQFIRALYTELDNHANQSRNIASKNSELEFDGKVILQADRDLPYELLKKVMYTSMMAGYSSVKVAVLSKD